MKTKKGKLIPYIIIGVFVSFGIYIGSFVYRSHQLKVNLVSDDYYAQELVYQDQITIIESSEIYKHEYKVRQTLDELTISVSPKLDELKGEVLFYRPSDREMDFKVVLHLNSKNKMVLKSSEIPTGYWLIKTSGTQDSTNYYFEQDITIE